MTTDSALQPQPSARSTQASESDGASDHVHRGLSGLGLARWVQFGFFLLGIVLFWLLDRVITTTWDLFAEPKPSLISLIAAVVSVAVVVFLYRTSSVRDVSYNIASELSKVVWPTKQETWSSTIIVIIASLVAAVILGTLDALSSAVTDLIPTFFGYVGSWW